MTPSEEKKPLLPVVQELKCAFFQGMILKIQKLMTWILLKEPMRIIYLWVPPLV